MLSHFRNERILVFFACHPFHIHSHSSSCFCISSLNISLCVQDEFHGRLLNLEYEINPPANRDGDLDADKECKDDIDNRICFLKQIFPINTFKIQQLLMRPTILFIYLLYSCVFFIVHDLIQGSFKNGNLNLKKYLHSVKVQ